ncbi:unnamed protein product [Parnassius apollo]|uniref:(apollo) hypothetical protein n=1 Tax=Parnassius apollo TaxID=110799 RepID=A0A8S3WWR0_PARAO|nr:unnamed protein product [Parnassius apollo]
MNKELNTIIMTEMDPYTDVVELCALLQCLGFSIKSLETSDGNVSQEGGVRTVVINCQASGLHVVLESNNVSCSCPANSQQQNSGFWQVSGTKGGKQLDKEYGSSVLGSLPKAYRERLTKELLDIVRCIKENNESDLEKPKERESLANKSASMTELKTPEKQLFQLPSGTPTRYRSLDTLTTGKEVTDENLPAPGLLQKHISDKSSTDTNDQDNKKLMCQSQRQSTYTLSSTPESIRQRNKTSSPIQGAESKILENLISAEKAAEDLRNKLANIVKQINEDGKNDSSMCSLVLDVSKISVLKGAETSKAQFASSPNLSALGSGIEDFSKSRLKRIESASTSNLITDKPTSKDGKMSKLRRISPKMFNLKKDTYAVSKIATSQENKSGKLNALFKPKIVTPVRVPKVSLEPSPNLSASRKKFSHVKSTIPRPAAKKE